MHFETITLYSSKNFPTLYNIAKKGWQTDENLTSANRTGPYAKYPVLRTLPHFEQETPF